MGTVARTLRALAAYAVLALAALGAAGCGEVDLQEGCGCRDPGSNSGSQSCGNRECRSVRIGGQTWMAENLNKATEHSYCYDNDGANCDKYGRLYNWEEAKSACQSLGWRLPTRDDWERLAVAVGGYHYGDDPDAYSKTWIDAGTPLKSTSGWKVYDDEYNGYHYDGNGTDAYGFRALPGGAGVCTHGDFDFGEIGERGRWWSSTEYNDYGAECAYYFVIGLTDDVHQDITTRNAGLGLGASVRCVKN